MGMGGKVGEKAKGSKEKRGRKKMEAEEAKKTLTKRS